MGGGKNITNYHFFTGKEGRGEGLLGARQEEQDRRCH